jgi:type I restriction enzyme S subunit
MQEYRTRLTADLVTGKLDVREAAAKLPDYAHLAPSQPKQVTEAEAMDETEDDDGSAD